jgi:hypothetical protein
MGFGFARHRLVHAINTSFAPANIEATAAVATALPDTADAFDIVDALGHFQFPEGMTLAAYRRSLPIPELNKQVMTMAFKTAIREKMSLSFGIVSGDAEQIQVSVAGTQIFVVLTRKD